MIAQLLRLRLIFPDGFGQLRNLPASAQQILRVPIGTAGNRAARAQSFALERHNPIAVSCFPRQLQRIVDIVDDDNAAEQISGHLAETIITGHNRIRQADHAFAAPAVEIIKTPSANRGERQKCRPAEPSRLQHFNHIAGRSLIIRNNIRNAAAERCLDGQLVFFVYMNDIRHDADNARPLLLVLHDLADTVAVAFIAFGDIAQRREPRLLFIEAAVILVVTVPGRGGILGNTFCLRLYADCLPLRPRNGERNLRGLTFQIHEDFFLVLTGASLHLQLLLQLLAPLLRLLAHGLALLQLHLDLRFLIHPVDDGRVAGVNLFAQLRNRTPDILQCRSRLASAVFRLAEFPFKFLAAGFLFIFLVCLPGRLLLKAVNLAVHPADIRAPRLEALRALSFPAAQVFLLHIQVVDLVLQRLDPVGQRACLLFELRVGFFHLIGFLLRLRQLRLVDADLLFELRRILLHLVK